MKTLLYSLAITLAFQQNIFAQESRFSTIAYVGDSHSYGRFGSTVEKHLSSIADRVIMQSSCGSTSSTWVGKTGYEKTVCGYWKKDGKEEIRSKEHKTPRFADELARYRPEVTVVQLGTNMAASAKPTQFRDSIESMMAAIKAEGSRCVWIGPPDANSKLVPRQRLKEVNEMLADLSKKHNCYYVDSLRLTQFPADNKEGIHYPPSASAIWGEKVSNEIRSYLKTLKN